MLMMPENLKRRLHELRNAVERKHAADGDWRDTKRREDQALGRLRVERFEETEIYAKEISIWFRKFFATDDCCELLRLCRVIQIFAANFRDGRPVPSSSMDRTTIEFRYNRRIIRIFLYSVEWHKGVQVEEDLLAYMPIMDPSELMVIFHPDFLKQWAEEIRSGKIWGNIERSLR